MLHRFAALSIRARTLMRSGAPRIIGFGLAVLMSAAVSLAAIPAMIAASGEAAWGSIALGQAIGLIGGVAVGYGWGWFGPARIAQYGPLERRVEYFESLLAKSVLVLPISIVASVAAYILAPSDPSFAATAAACSTSMGLSAAWYLVGLSKPFTMIAIDTLPRVATTAVAIVLMYTGRSAIMGPIGTLVGSLIVLVASSTWILRETGRADGPIQLRPLRTVLVHNGDGIASALASTVYNSAPIAIVSIAAPSIQPAFALVDKIKVLVVIAAAPAVTVLQGWVPRTIGHARLRRTKISLVGGAVFAAIIGVGTAIVTPSLVNWFGNGEISVSNEVAILLSCCVSVIIFQTILERVALTTADNLGAAVKALALGSVVGLPLVWVGSRLAGMTGALSGVFAALLVVVATESFAYARVAAESRGVLDQVSAEANWP